MCLLREWHVCKGFARASHTLAAASKCYILSLMHSPTVRKGAVYSNLTTYLTWHAKDTSITNNLTKAAQTTLVQTQGLNKPYQPTILSYSSMLPHRKTLVYTRGLDQLVTLYFSRLSPWTSYKLSRPGTDSFSIGQPLLPASRLKAWRLMYCPGPTKYMWHSTWHSKTRVHPPRQPWYRSADA